MAEKSEFLQNLLTQAAIKRDRQKREKGREIVRKAMPQMPGEPAPVNDYNSMLTNTGRGIYQSSPIPETRPFNEKEFRNDIVRKSIESNILTGGRHPKAAPLKTEKPEKEVKTSPISREVDRGGAKGTQTSPAPAKPGDLNAFADLLGSKYGIQFRNGFESNKLPGTGIGPVADGDEYGKHLNATKGTTGIGPFADGDTYARAINGNRGEVAEGAQKGTSAVPDVGDQKRAVRVGRFDPRQRDGGSSSFMAEESGPIVEQGPKKGGISARSRAFLDYDGPGGSMMALRAAEAESGYIRQGGKNYGISGSKDGKREFTEFNDEGRRALVKDGNARVSQQFLKDYMVGQTDAKAAENPAVENPVDVKPRLEPNSNMGPLADTEQYGKMIDATRGMTGMGPLANGEVYGAYLDGREPMMRDPRKK